MCSLDVTVVQLIKRDSNGSLWAVGHDQVHTCRDYAMVRSWLDKRHEEVPDDPGLTNLG
jgi:hypothetical protein